MGLVFGTAAIGVIEIATRDRPGRTLNSATGVVSGTAIAAGSFSVTVQVSRHEQQALKQTIFST